MKTKLSFMEKKFFTMLGGGTIGSILASLLVIIDAIIAGIFIGENAVAGVNLITPVYSLAAFLGMIVSEGIPILFSRAIGNFDKKEADNLFGLGLISTILSGVVMFVLLYALGDKYIGFYNASPEVNAEAASYLFWMQFVILLLPSAILLYEMIYVDGDETITAIAGIAEAVSNIGVSIILSNRIGIAGLGIGSLTGRIVFLIITFFHFGRKTNNLSPNLFFSFKKLFESARYSVIDAGTYLFLAIYSAFINKYLLSRFGTGMISVIAIMSLVKEVGLSFDGIGKTITPFISTYLSEECYDGVKKIWKLAGKTAIAEGVLAVIGLLLAAPYLPRILGFGGDANEIVAINGGRILSISMPFICLLYLISSYYLLIDRIAMGTIACAMRDVALAIPLIYILGSSFGIYGVFWGDALATMAGYFLTKLYVIIRYGKKAWPLLLEDKISKTKGMLFELSVDPEDIIETRNNLEKVLIDEGFVRRDVMRFILLFEEIFMYIYDNNPNTEVSAECELIIKNEDVRLIGRDNGKVLNLNDKDMLPDSFRSYALSQFIANRNVGAVNLTALSFNRNMFEMTLEKQKSV